MQFSDSVNGARVTVTVDFSPTFEGTFEDKAEIAKAIHRAALTVAEEKFPAPVKEEE